MNSIVLPLTFSVAAHTDFVGKNSIFVAIEGYAESGTNYIKIAIDRGARVIVVQKDAVISEDIRVYCKQHGVAIRTVVDAREALADLSAQHAGFPAQKLKIIGVTGTKGKTTTAFVLEHILRTAGYKTALISSAENHILDHTFSAPLTTPQPDYLQQFLKVCVEHDVDYVVMEVAAQALSLHRVKGIEFDGVIFTNFSHEHLEFYRTLEDYFQAKCLIFSKIKTGTPIVVNYDNQWSHLIAARYAAVGYGFSAHGVRYHGFDFTDYMQSIKFSLIRERHKMKFNCPVLFGYYNGYNILSAVSMALELGLCPRTIEQAIQSFTGVPGRLQQTLLPNGARSFIDYAHNPDSFNAVLSALRPLTHQLIVVFGAGGARDKTKRPIMGFIASNIADVVILTSDNPRQEDPQDIINDIRAGIISMNNNKIIVELDRKVAIQTAYGLSSKGSIIALLGKGPDEYQIIGTTKHCFSESSIVKELG